MFRRILIFVLLCIAANNAKSQYDAQFSQNMFNKLAVNPAYAGASENINLVALNRNQWNGNMAVKTTVFSGDMPVKFFNLNSGVGINFMNDEIGNFTNLSILLNYAVKFELGRGTLSVGLNLGLLNQSVKGEWYYPTEGTVYDESDPHVPASDVTGSAFDSGLGVYYKDKKFYAGASISHLNSPKPNFKDEFNYTATGTFYLLGGYNHKIEDTAYELLPSFFYKTDGRSFQVRSEYAGQIQRPLLGRVDVSLSGCRGSFSRHRDEEWQVRFGYSYDITTSAIKRGTHEVTVGYNIDVDFDKRTKRYKSVRYL